MAMLLRNFDFAVKYLDYELKFELENNSNPRISGWYKYINGILSALLVTNNNIYFIYGESEYLITDTYRVLLKEKNKVENEFILFNGTNELIRFSDLLPEPFFYPFPFNYIDEEDDKWGSFIAGIINSKERQKDFISHFMEYH